MSRVTRVILIDLLVERSEFVHGGNQEVIQPIAERSAVEVLLVTPRMQSAEAGLRAQEQGLVRISEDDVPDWDYEYPIWEESSMEMHGNEVVFRRIAMPLHGDDELTGDDVDGTAEDGLTTILGPTMTFTMIGAASTAWAYTSCIVTTGGIYKISISNRGGGYIYAPNVGFGSAPIVGPTSSYSVTGIGSVGTMLDIQACNKNIATNQKSVQQIDIVNPGYGYTISPGIAVTAVASGPGSGFAGTAFIADGTLGVVTVTNAGSGFASDRVNVTFNTPLAFTNTGIGTTATGVAIIGPSGTVSEVRYTNAGSGYTTGDLPISVTIADPESSGSGDFIFNETVTGGTSSATARVRTWNSTTNILEVASVVGSFVIGETLTGSSSGATHDLRKIDKDPLDDGFADNTQIETSADAILDFTEQNPFGTP